MNKRKNYFLSILLLPAIFFTVCTEIISQNCNCNIWKKDEKISSDLLIGNPDPICKAKGHEQKAQTYLDIKELDSAQLSLEIAEAYLKKEGCKEQEWLSVNRLRSSLHFFKAEYQAAIDYSLKMLTAVQTLNDSEQEADVMLSIAQIFSRMGQADRSLDYLHKALPIIEKINSSNAKTDLLNKAGSRYYFLFQDTKEKPLLDSATIFFN